MYIALFYIVYIVYITIRIHISCSFQNIYEVFNVNSNILKIILNTFDYLKFAAR